MIQPSIIPSALSFDPYFDPAFSNSLISLIASAFDDLDSVYRLAEALISEISSEGITKSAIIFFDTLDLLIDSIIDAIYLLNAT